MAIYVIDPDVVLAFRRNHRKQVRRDRSIKRKKYAERVPEKIQYDAIDKEWLRAVERDRS